MVVCYLPTCFVCIEPETIVALSPYWTQHINRFGRYSLDMNRCPPPIDFGTPCRLLKVIGSMISLKNCLLEVLPNKGFSRWGP